MVAVIATTTEVTTTFEEAADLLPGAADLTAAGKFSYTKVERKSLYENRP